MRAVTTTMINARKTARRSLINTALTASSLLALCAPALADNWTDHTGDGITVDTSIPDTTNITQSLDIVKVHGDGDINAGWTVNVAQPSSKSKYVLYDVENDPTYILGTLNANGKIYIFDKNGVIFGRDSVVNVGGIIASTGYITDANLQADKLVFEGVGGPDAGAIDLQGTINVADAGIAAFVAPTVRNSGIINAKLGHVVFSAGEKVTLDFYGDQLVQIAAQDSLENALLENTGTIKAEGGTVVMSAQAASDAVDNVINMDGVVDVSSVSVKGGKIILGGGNKGIVKVSGKLNADGKDGGNVKVTGQNILVSDTSVISTNAKTSGNGGIIDIIAVNGLLSNGRLESKGGLLSGNGGAIDTSGHGWVDIAGTVDVAAYNGLHGSWLIDPSNLTISSALATNVGGNGSAGNPFKPDGDFVSLLRRDTLQTALNAGGNVFITTVGTPDKIGQDGTITFLTDISKSSASDSTLTLTAAGSIIQGSDYSLISTNGKLNVAYNAQKGILVNGVIRTRGGNVDFNANNDIVAGGEITTLGGNVTMNAGQGAGGATNADVLVGGNITTLGGNVSLTANDDVRLNSIINTAGNGSVNGGDVSLIAQGDDVDSGDVELGANARILTSDESVFNAFEGDVFIAAEQFIMNAAARIDAADGGTADGTVTITRSTNGSISVGNSPIYGDMDISNAELAGITAENLNIGDTDASNNKVTHIFVDGVDTTANISDLTTFNVSKDEATGVPFNVVNDVAEANNNVLFWNTNAFNQLTVNADDNINILSDSSVTTNGETIFNADTNGGGVGLMILGDSAQLNTQGSNFTYNGVEAIFFAGSNIDADGGNILLNNTGIFYSADADSLSTSGFGTITLNQHAGTFNAVIDPTYAPKNVSYVGSIQNAIDAVDNSGAGLNTIYVSGGTFLESVSVYEDNFLLKGNNFGIGVDDVRNAETIVDPNSPGFHVTSNNVTIDGFEITGATGADGYGVWVDGADDVTLSNNIIHDVSQNAVYADNSGSLDVIGNLVYNTGTGVTGGHGIFLNNSDDAIIDANYVGYNKLLSAAGDDNISGDGIRLVGSDDAKITGNRIIETKRTTSQIGSGINLISSNRAVIGGPLAADRNYTYSTEWDGIRVQTSDGVRVENNSVYLAERVGVYSENSTNFTVVGNNINNTSFGPTSGATQTGAIHANKGSNVTITDNFTNDSGYGVKLVDVGGVNSVKRNTVNNTEFDGIFASGTNDVSIDDNFVGYGVDGAFEGGDDSTIGGIGINIKDVKTGEVLRNKIAHTGGNGIYLNNVNADGGAYITVGNNYIDNTGSDGLATFKGTKLLISTNLVGTLGVDGNIKGDGMYIDRTTFGDIRLNTITNTFSPSGDKGSGIHLNNGNLALAIAGSDDTIVQNNVIFDTAWDGVRVESSDRTTIIGNDIDDIERTGVYVENSTGVSVEDNDIDDTGHDGVRFHSVTNSEILDNDIGLTGAIGTGADVNNRHGIRLSSAGGAFNNLITIQGNEIEGAIGNGISMEHGNNITIGGAGVGQGNTITNSTLAGILIRRGDEVTISNNILAQTGGFVGTGIGILGQGNLSGSQNQNISLVSNTVTDFDTGMEFQAGIIDLTGAANTITGGTTGLRFDLFARPGTVLQLAEDDAIGTSTPFDGATPPTTAPTDFAGTIGTTIFSGQSDNYVVLANGAFWDTVNNVPFWMNGQDASYDGFVPNTVVGPLSQAQYDALDAKFVDYMNTGLDGIFFFGVLPEVTAAIDQNDLFREFAGFNGDITGLNIRILGLPSTGLPGANFANITPFAGAATTTTTTASAEGLNAIETAAGDTTTDGGQPAATSPQDLSAIDTAAGGENTACWGDAMTAAGTGQAVNVVYGGSFDDTLSVAACGTAF